MATSAVRKRGRRNTVWPWPIRSSNSMNAMVGVRPGPHPNRRENKRRRKPQCLPDCEMPEPESLLPGAGQGSIHCACAAGRFSPLEQGSETPMELRIPPIWRNPWRYAKKQLQPPQSLVPCGFRLIQPAGVSPPLKNQSLSLLFRARKGTISAGSSTSRGFRQKPGQVPVIEGKMSRAVEDAPAAKAIETSSFSRMSSALSRRRPSR